MKNNLTWLVLLIARCEPAGAAGGDVACRAVVEISVGLDGLSCIRPLDTTCCPDGFETVGQNGTGVICLEMR